MVIRINKDFLTEYKDDFWKGFNFRECVCIAIGGAFGVGGAYLVHQITGLEPATAVYFGVPLAMPAIIYGFYKYQGYMEPKRLLQEMMYTSNCRQLSYQTENHAGCRVFEMRKKNESVRGNHQKKEGGRNVNRHQSK